MTKQIRISFVCALAAIGKECQRIAIDVLAYAQLTREVCDDGGEGGADESGEVWKEYDNGTARNAAGTVADRRGRLSHTVSGLVSPSTSFDSASSEPSAAIVVACCSPLPSEAFSAHRTWLKQTLAQLSTPF